MYFKFQCSHCGKSLKVSEDKAGKRANCPYCRHAVTVPEPEPPADDRSEVMSDLLGQLAPADEPRASAARELPGEEEGPPAGKKKRGRKPRNDDGAGEQFAQGTEVSLWWTGLYGLVGTAWFYGLVFLIAHFRPSYYFDLFIDRGSIPYWETMFMFWSLAILLAKWKKYRRQKASMLFDVLPTELGQEITPQNVDKFIEHVRALPSSPGESFLVNRVLRGLTHFKVRKSNGEVGGMLASQSEIDATAVYSSYTLMKVFIWVIPILGFIGTVVGMSSAIGNFEGAIGSASDISALKGSLGQIVGGLAVAFDTTFVALVMSMALTIPQNSLQKAEEDLLNWVDEYCNENLIKRLEDGGQATPRDASPAGVVDRIAAIQKELLKIQESHVASLRGTTGTIENHTRQVQQSLDAITGRVETAMAGLVERADRTQVALSDQTRASANDLKDCLRELGKGINALNQALTKLNSDPVLSRLPVRRGLFGFGRRSSNGS